jgi:putative restriction endonuclease
MRYWWVNQNGTYKHELAGGYLWSPKSKANGHRNPFYEFMKAVSPGDIVFSFVDTKIPAIGVAGSNAYEAPKPLEFGKVGAYWDVVGWRVDVQFSKLQKQIRPVDHIERLRPVLPTKYAPLQPNGDGLQAVYLTAVNEMLAAQLIDLIGTEARAIVQDSAAIDPEQSPRRIVRAVWEAHQVEQIRSSSDMSETEKSAIILARRGQGLFRSNVFSIEKRCRLTGTTNLDYLRASHTKPWRDANNEERLDGENGLMLTPDADFLFDRGFLSFEGSGKVVVSPVADRTAIERMGLAQSVLCNVGPFSAGQRQYLEFHRESIFLEAKVSDS